MISDSHTGVFLSRIAAAASVVPAVLHLGYFFNINGDGYGDDYDDEWYW